MVLGIQETVSSKASVVLRGGTVRAGITICKGWREERISRTQSQPWKPGSQQLFWLRPYPCSARRETDIKWSWIRHHLPWEKYQTAAHCWGWRRVCTTTTQQHSEQLSTALLSPSTALCQLCHIIALGSHHQNSTMHLSIKIQLVKKRLLMFPPSRLLGYVRNTKTIDGKCMER